MHEFQTGKKRLQQFSRLDERQYKTKLNTTSMISIYNSMIKPFFYIRKNVAIRLIIQIACLLPQVGTGPTRPEGRLHAQTHEPQCFDLSYMYTTTI